MKRFIKAIAAIILMVAVVCATGCTKSDDSNNGGNNTENGGGSGDGNGSGGGNGGGNGGGGSNTQLPAGMYLGVIGFNQQLHVHPITRLDDAAIEETKQFIENLPMGGATLLYHAVNTSLDMLASYEIPENLKSVYVVNFTDGLDEGSYAFSNYSSGAQYLQAVSQRIRNERIHGDTIKAHTIGIQGNDVLSYDLAEFLNNLNGISQLPSERYVRYVTEFEDVLVELRGIAEMLHQQSINAILTLKFPVPDPNTRVRFCFDITTPAPHEPNEALQSEQYIEGVYITDSEGKGVLTNVRYVGMSSSSGNMVRSVSMEPPFVTFNFEGMKDADNNNFTTSNLDHLLEWKYNTNANAWINNSEWSHEGTTDVINKYFSSLVMLNLDCSQSLGSQKFRQLKNCAKDFVDVLRTDE